MAEYFKQVLNANEKRSEHKCSVLGKFNERAISIEYVHVEQNEMKSGKTPCQDGFQLSV